MLKKSETPRDLRKKLSRANASHISLKNKHRDKQYEIKKLKICLSAMEASRDQWRFECKKNQILAKDLALELSSVKQNCEKLIAKFENTESCELKKKR